MWKFNFFELFGWNLPFNEGIMPFWILFVDSPEIALKSNKWSDQIK